jgi:hypothetical protein
MFRKLLRLTNPEIAFGFLIATVFWIAVLGWQAAYAPTEIEKQKCYDTAQQSGHKSEECKSLWERTTSDPVAFFTFWLVIFTAVLGGSTILLYFTGEKQISVARQSADAATKAAEAAIAGLLPMVRTHAVQGEEWKDWPVEGEILKGKNPKGVMLTTSFINSGNGVATVIGYATDSIVGPTFLNDPIPKNKWKPKDGLFIAPQGTLNMEESGATLLIGEHLDMVLRGEWTFWFWGVIRIRDFIGDETEIGFAWTYIPPDKRRGDSNLRFKEVYIEGRTYYKKYPKPQNAI